MLPSYKIDRSKKLQRQLYSMSGKEEIFLGINLILRHSVSYLKRWYKMQKHSLIIDSETPRYVFSTPFFPLKWIKYIC